MRKTPLLLCTLFIYALSYAQQEIRFDLAELSTDKVNNEYLKKNGHFFITLTNTLPGTVYFYKVTREYIPLKPLTLPGQGMTLLDCTAQTNSYIYELGKIETNTKKKNETEVRSTNQKYTAASSAECLEKLNEMIVKYTNYQIPEIFNAAENVKFTFTIFRLVVDDKAKGITDTVKWLINLESENKGEWRTHYGFTFTGNVFSMGNEYFCQQQADTSGQSFFVISKQNDSSKLKFTYAPTFLFSYVPLQTSKKVIYAFTGGLGINNTAIPVVLAGVSFIVHENILVSFGGAFTGVNTLNGIYKAGDTTDTFLDYDALHKLSPMINPYISIGFIFGSNPFSTNSSTN